LSDWNYFSDGKHRWNAQTLWHAAASVRPEEMNVGHLFSQIACEEWNIRFGQFVEEVDRLLRADLSYPIILTPDGYVCDGWHRLAKAKLNGQETIMAVRLTVMPIPDGDDNGS
jgi:hypothetical protein